MVEIGGEVGIPCGSPRPKPLTVAALRQARRQLITMHYRTQTGHVGGNLSAIDALMVVHHELMAREDQFILSKGHAAGAYYVTLSTLGRLPEAELATFHQDGTRLAGHPLADGIDDILFATGSLGHGLSLAAGLALAARLKGLSRRVFCLTSDGEWQEGSTFEALIFAAHHHLTNLTVLVDHNRLQGFGATADVASMDPLYERLAGFPITRRRCDGHDPEALRQTIGPMATQPVVVVLETRKGNGVPDFENRLESHYLPLTEAQYHAALKVLDDRA